jgi:orotidine-5'-phosphate decarboxylase
MVIINPSSYCALALDNISSLNDVRHIINITKPFFDTYKIGLELFTRFGCSVIDVVANSGKKIFLDLKYHDIPQTVENAVKVASRLGVHYLTIHTQGGTKMMKAACNAAHSILEEGITPPKIIGVTLLTSIDSKTLLNELNVSVSIEQHIKILALRAVDALLDGIVCSAIDLPQVKPLLPDGFEIITPGIRLPTDSFHDQKRVATPKEAIQNGATLIVVGRSVTESKDPQAAASEIIKNIES